MSTAPITGDYGRYPGPASGNAFPGDFVKIQAAWDSTGGMYSLSESSAPAESGPPMHIHYNEDEAICVLEGSLQIWYGDNSYFTHAGDFTFLPKGVSHTWQVTGNRPARFLIITSPPESNEAFETSDEFSMTMHIAGDSPAEWDAGSMMTITPKYGIEVFAESA